MTYTCKCCGESFEARTKQAAYCKKPNCQRYKVNARSQRHKRRKRGMEPGPYQPRLWTDEAVAILYDRAGELTAHGLAKLIATKTGQRFRVHSIYWKMSQLGIKPSENLGFLTIREAARQIGCTARILEAYIAAHDFPTCGRGKYRFIRLEDFPRLKERFTPPQEPTLSTTEAARRLHFHNFTIIKQIHRGKLEAYQVGARWRIPVRVVAQILLERRKEQAASSSAKRTA